MEKWYCELSQKIISDVITLCYHQIILKSVKNILVLTHLTPKMKSIETSQLIYKANQLTGFCIMATLAFNELMEK